MYAEQTKSAIVAVRRDVVDGVATVTKDQSTVAHPRLDWLHSSKKFWNSYFSNN